MVVVAVAELDEAIDFGLADFGAGFELGLDWQPPEQLDMPGPIVRRNAEDWS